MAQLPVKAFTTVVSDYAAACQGACATLVDFSVGSVLRAVAEAAAGVVLWLQAMVLQVLTLTRAATSVGPDLDSWMADFGFARLPASSATGLVTFSRFTATQAALVPAGATVRTSDNSQSYAVTAAPSHPAWNAALNGYTLAATTASVTVPVAALAPGSAGNAQADAVTVLTSAVPGVDTVTNASAFTSGIDAEPDSAYRTRFVLYLASLSKATKAALGAAILGVRQGLQYSIVENVDATGALGYGQFQIYVDDGTGSPPTPLLDAVTAAVEAVRPVGSRFGVFAPTVIPASISMTVTSAPGYSHPVVVGNVGTALAAAINSLPLGAGLPYTLLPAVAYSVDGVSNVTAVLLNGATADIAATPAQVVKSGTISVA